MHPAAERLARYVTDGAEDATEAGLAGWMTGSARFRAFVEAHRDKVRKKLRGATDEDAGLDVRTELRVAHRLLADRRVTLAFEPSGSTRGGPDFAVTFRDHVAFNLEVTRVRAGADTSTVGRVVLAKLRQLPPGSANVLLMATDAPEVDEAAIHAAIRDLRARADAGDVGLDSAKAFYQRFLRLGAVLAWTDGAEPAAWTNSSARISVPERALRACIAAFGSG
jgi:hypothetical protein